MLEQLSGIRVLDLTSNVAGPFGTLVLRDLGADVLKVESPAGDPVRSWPPFTPDGRSTTFAALNRGKRSVAVDLKDPDGRRVLLELAGDADVVVESMRPGVMDRLGLSWDVLHAANQRLVYTSISAFGGVGPLADRPGYDAIIQAYSGIMNLTGEPDGPPVRVGTGLIDMGTGMWAALATIAALRQREVSGAGARVSATLLGTAVGFLFHHLASIDLAGVVPRRLGTGQHNTAPYEAIPASDGFVMVGAANDTLWQRFCDALGDDGRLRDSPLFATNADRVRNRARLVAAAGELAGELTTAELAARFEKAGVPASAVRDTAELLGDPQVHAMELLQPWGEHRLGVVPVSVDGRMSTVDGSLAALGAHGREVLADLGMSGERIDELVRRGTVHIGSDVPVEGE
ncbi:CaiB/BaiF CoA transferase family protein [Actinophytocola sp.]|uniref:CaiB/BaiF CoA transferase family protein n=1 Tax=Actinophytocola sp. TaxID=1872138 RepID=UPI003D6AD6BF